MKAVTLRNLPPKVAQTIRQRARDKRVSVNKAVIGLLEEQAGISGKRPPPLYHDLDALTGSWTKAEAAAFDKALAKQRTIDLALWK
jgi:hypothetical protein